MTKKIEVSYDFLRKLYVNQGLSTHKIAEKINCYPSVIQDRLREYGIPLKKPKEKIIISKDKLSELYVKKGLSTQRIAKILGISSCTIYYKLKEAGIKTRPKKIIKISKEILKKLYLDKALSCSEIAEKFNCDRITIFEKLKKYSIKTRNASLANTVYPKKRFNGTDELKAYMTGFRLGDLNVKAKNENSTIMVKSGTTKKEQVNLIKSVYGQYGHFKCDFRNGVYQVYCNLDSSFNFLLRKEDKIEDWIICDNSLFLAFLAGYSDAEGSFGVYSNSARFRVGSYDKNILKQIFTRLNLLGIKATFNLEGRAGTNNQNKDFYRVNVMAKDSLLKLINLFKTRIKHEKRYHDMITCENNILERNKRREIEIR